LGLQIPILEKRDKVPREVGSPLFRSCDGPVPSQPRWRWGRRGACAGCGQGVLPV